MMRKFTHTRSILFFVLAVTVAIQSCQGKVYMNVSPYPARIFANAPPGVPVLMVNAYDNETGEAVTSFRLEKMGMSEYFNISSSGVLQTAQTIDRDIGFQFRFFVFAVNTGAGLVEWKHVIIEVSEKNVHQPEFKESSYDMAVYRYAPAGTLIGKVSAVDRDEDPYNKLFTIFAQPRQTALDYISVTPSGDIILDNTPEDAMKVLRALVLAVDDGSPQLTGTTTVIIYIDDVNQPETFCLSSNTDTDTLCWKNPMPGRDHPGYNVVVQGEGLVLHKHVQGNGSIEEFCISTDEMILGQNYSFRVTLDNQDTTIGIELIFQKKGPGFSVECMAKDFAACNFLQPCENGASCVMGQAGGMDYTCVCPSGWQGQNCTQRDLCAVMPCQNNGTCLFTGHQQYTCHCPFDYFGLLCQNHNACVKAETCQNGGVCRMYENGSHSCQCPDYYTGDDCSVPDPCSPSLCGEGGACVPLSDTKSNCSCYKGYYGERCGKINLCQTDNPCKNGGICLSTGNSTIKCMCPANFTGWFCETYNSCELACQNNASCDMMEDGNYNCTCLPSYYGKECQHFNRCGDNPCHNGTCNMEEDMPLCDCDPGFYGDVCDKYNDCLKKPCANHGRCVPIPEEEREKDDLPYDCQCNDSWWGQHCEFPNSCNMSICLNGATCQNTPPRSFKCHCTPGYYERDCSKFNMCDVTVGGQEVCQNGGTCHNTSDSYQCACLNGYYGQKCELRDQCYSSPCLNSGICSMTSDTFYNCTCKPGYTGKHCEHENVCSQQSCLNGGSCITDPADGSGQCACSEGFLGYFCQIADPCYDGHNKGQGATCGTSGSCESINRTMVDSLRDEVNDLEFLFMCRCDQGHTGKKCENPVSSDCAEVHCLNNGDCQHGICICPPGYTGARCESALSVCLPDPCPDGFRCQATGLSTHSCVCENGWDLPDCKPACHAEESASETTGRFFWHHVFAGETAKVMCPYGGKNNNNSYATRHCLPVGENDAVWEDMDDSSCRELGLLEASRRLNALKELTSNPAALGASEVNNYTSILEELYVYTLMDQQVATVMMSVVSNLDDVNVSVTIRSNEENGTSARLLKLLDDYTAQVNVSEGSNVTIISPSFEVVAVSINDTSSSFTFVPSVGDDNVTTQLDVSITIPPEAYAQESEEVTSDRKPTRLQMVGHRKSQLFIPNNSGYNKDWIENQPVLSAIVTGKQIINLSSPVVYRIRNKQPQSNYTCVYWDPQNSTWSTEGVITTVKSGNSTECQSFHLTSFAVLLDPSPDYVLSAVHETVLSYISYIGSAVSLFCLVLTIITYSLFRSLNKDKSGKILLNLCVALLLLNAIFLANSLTTENDDDDGLDDNTSACMAVAVLLHYLLLASLFWMLVEAVEMYRALVTVFAKYAQCYMLKRCLIGWGLPIVIVAITLGVDRANYDPDGAFCFISRSNPAAYYGSLVAPACLVLVINTVIFVMVTRVILKPRFQQQKQKESEGITPAQVRGAFTVMFLLGVTWVFGPLAIKEAKVVFNYLFCILNSLQGFLIFVFRCLFNPEVRLCWVQLAKTGTLKRRRGPIRSNVYSDTSSKADAKSATYPNGNHGSGFLGNSGTSTTKTTLMHTNGWHPKLNGIEGRPVLERRGTKFSTLEFFQGTPESTKKNQQNPITEDERYGDGNLSNVDDTNIFTAMDYYETGHKGHTESTSAVPYEDFHEDNGVMDYYESIRTSRKEESSHVTESHQVTEQSLEHRQGTSSSSLSEKRSSGLKNEQEELTYL